MSNYDYLDLATIWKSKAKGTLSLVIALANFDLPKKYAKTNPPTVVFTDGLHIFSSSVDRFLDLRYFVRKDERAYEHLMQLFSNPITEDEDQPLLQDDDDDDLVLADSDDSEVIAEPMTPVEASALTKEESKLYETSSGKIIEANALMPARIVITATENSEALDSAANSFYMYDQMRTLDGVFYHKLTFSELSAVYTILNNVQSIESLSVQYKDVIIPIEPDYIVSTYTSVENVYNDAHKLTDVRYAYNIIVAQAIQEDEAELSLKDESDEPTSVESTTTATANATESFVPIADSTPNDTGAVGTRVESENPFNVNGSTVQESTGELVDESNEDDSFAEDGVEEISINSDLQESSEEENVEDILEEPKEQEPELENAEELLEDHKLLVESLVMPEDDAEDAPIDEISESLAEKLETVLALEKDNYNSNNASNEEQPLAEELKEAEETKESESKKPLNEAAFDGLSTSEEKKED